MDNAFSVDVKHDEGQSKMIISGELIINHVNKIRESILEAVNFSNNLDIHITNPSSLDITFIQLMSALKKSIENKGNSCIIEGIFGEDIDGLITNSGFNDLFKL